MKKIACCIFSYEITKGMKSYGPIALLKKTQKSKELLCYNIDYLNHIIKHKDIYIVLGFEEEKIKKRLKDYHINIGVISNQEYNNYNTGYAFQLMLDQIKNKLDLIEGILFLNSNMLIKKMPRYITDKSWVLLDAIKNKDTYIGCRLSDNSKHPEYFFYNTGNALWTEVFYLSVQDIRIILDKSHLYHNHMFGFEIMNTAIEKQNIKFDTIYLDKSKDLIRINGLKDKHKVQ